ncbi:hypothetical protein GWN42_03355 [candidate division KSB1 bacterium]|nr:hypothetical protein [candidate division KSB1 bacterium]
MQIAKTAGMIVLIIGIGLLAASLLADVIGIGDDVGFGLQQIMGTIAGVVITTVGLCLTLKVKDRPNGQPYREKDAKTTT